MIGVRSGPRTFEAGLGFRSQMRAAVVRRSPAQDRHALNAAGGFIFNPQIGQSDVALDDFEAMFARDFFLPAGILGGWQNLCFGQRRVGFCFSS